MDSIKHLTELFAKFPTIGKRTAGRFVFYLIKQSPQEIEELILAITDLKKSIQFCNFCFQPFESSNQDLKLCQICSDPSRNNSILCVVEKETDLLTIEATKKYKGLYFILGGTLTLRKTDGTNLKIDDLKNRINQGGFTEIIVALNPTPEGKSTSILLQRAIKELPKYSTLKITHLAQGLPVGGELEYADAETLESAFEGRK